MSSPLPSTPVEPNLQPVDSVYTPNVATPAAVQGGTQATDTLGKTYAPIVAQLVAGGAVIGHVIVDSGAITETNSAAIKTDLDSIVTNTTGLATQATLALAKTDLDTIVTQTVGLATQATLAQVKSDADSIVTNTTGLATQATLSSAKTDLDNIYTNLNQLASGDSLTIANIPVFIPGMSNGSTGAERLHSVDGVNDGTTFGLLGQGTWLFNGTGWDKQRNNLDNITVLASAARTTTQTQADQTNYNHRGIMAVLDMTTVGTGSVTLEIDAKDPVSGKYIALLTGAAVVSNSTNIYTVYPGNTVTANVSASTVLPRTWRIKVTANNANSATYSVGAMLLL